jgi:hypothetical protein
MRFKDFFTTGSAFLQKNKPLDTHREETPTIPSSLPEDIQHVFYSTPGSDREVRNEALRAELMAMLPTLLRAHEFMLSGRIIEGLRRYNLTQTITIPNATTLLDSYLNQQTQQGVRYDELTIAEMRKVLAEKETQWVDEELYVYRPERATAFGAHITNFAVQQRTPHEERLVHYLVRDISDNPDMYAGRKQQPHYGLDWTWWEYEPLIIGKKHSKEGLVFEVIPHRRFYHNTAGEERVNTEVLKDYERVYSFEVESIRAAEKRASS